MNFPTGKYVGQSIESVLETNIGYVAYWMDRNPAIEEFVRTKLRDKFVKLFRAHLQKNPTYNDKYPKANALLKVTKENRTFYKGDTHPFVDFTLAAEISELSVNQIVSLMNQLHNMPIRLLGVPFEIDGRYYRIKSMHSRAQGTKVEIHICFGEPT